jgi:hypothetical protein
MRFGREESEWRVFMLRSDLIISELFNKFWTSYHLKSISNSHGTTKPKRVPSKPQTNRFSVSDHKDDDVTVTANIKHNSLTNGCCNVNQRERESVCLRWMNQWTEKKPTKIKTQLFYQVFFCLTFIFTIYVVSWE